MKIQSNKNNFWLFANLTCRSESIRIGTRWFVHLLDLTDAQTYQDELSFDDAIEQMIGICQV